jgi:hypothetical protein
MPGVKCQTDLRPGGADQSHGRVWFLCAEGAEAREIQTCSTVKEVLWFLHHQDCSTIIKISQGKIKESQDQERAMETEERGSGT